MSDLGPYTFDAEIIEYQETISIVKLCRLAGANSHDIRALVEEGIIEPADGNPESHHFQASVVTRTRKAIHLQRDLGINAAGIALIFDLMDEISRLKSRIY